MAVLLAGSARSVRGPPIRGSEPMSSLVAMIFLSMSQLAMSCCSEDYAENHELAGLGVAVRRANLGLAR